MLSVGQMLSVGPMDKSECQKCKVVALAAGKLYTNERAIKERMDFFLDRVCDEVAPKFQYLDCKKEIAAYWPEIARGIFGVESGWYAPQNSCEDLRALNCNWMADIDQPEVSCEYCEGRLNGTVQYFDHPPIIGDIIYGVQFLGFCNQFGLESMNCMKKMAWTIPRIMYQLKRYPNNNKDNMDVCVNVVKCV